jgi:hypothetical protein
MAHYLRVIQEHLASILSKLHLAAAISSMAIERDTRTVSNKAAAAAAAEV